MLARYRDPGIYTDCFRTEVPRAVSLAQFIEAFYTTRVFRLERWILARAVNKPSSAADVVRLASGEAGEFAAWTVAARESDQILLRDFRGETASWLCVAAEPPGVTTLYFGSAVMAGYDEKTGDQRLPGSYRAMMGVHRLYSRILLNTARRRLMGGAG